MNIQEMIESSQKELGHLLNYENSDPDREIKDICKCLCSIILLFLEILKQYQNQCLWLIKFLKIILEDLNICFNPEKNERSEDESDEIETIHVKEHQVRAYDEKRHKHPQNQNEKEAIRNVHAETIDYLENIYSNALKEKNKAQLEASDLKRELKNKDQDYVNLQEKYDELQEKYTNLQLNLNSNFSNTPSSKDMRYLADYPTYRNGEKKAHEQGEDVKRTVGGQKGHPGQEVRLVEGIEPDEIIYCYPDGIPEEERDHYEWKEGAVHDRLNIVTKTQVSRYVQMETTVDGKRGPRIIKGSFPEEAQATLSYGPTIEREVFILYNICNSSMANISKFFCDNSGIGLSESKIVGIIKKCSERFVQARDKIIEAMQKEAEDKQNIFQMDETGVNVNGQTYWDHIAVSKNFILHTIHESRGLKGSRESGVFDKIQGTVVSDFFKNYIGRQFDGAYCWSHTERDLAAAHVRDPDQKWVDLMLDFARDSYLAWKKARDEHRQIPEKELTQLVQQYDHAIDVGLKEDGKSSKKTSVLLRRMANFKDGLLAHLYNVEIPRSNNSSELAARSIKSKLDVSTMFKTVKGAKNYAAYLSVVDSAKRQHLNPFIAIDQVLGGNVDYLITHKLVKSLIRTAPRITYVVTHHKDDKNKEKKDGKDDHPEEEK